MVVLWIRKLMAPVLVTLPVIGVVLSAPSAAQTPDQCKDVIPQDGAKAIELYRTRYEYRRVLESHLVNMTFQQAKTDKSLTGNIAIGDVILGAGFDETTFNLYKNYLQKDLSLRVDVKYDVDIMVSTGDPMIVNAWLTCMRNQNPGLIMYFSNVYANSAVLNLEFRALGIPAVRVHDYSLPKGVKVTAGSDYLTGKRLLVANTPQQVALSLPDAKTVVPVTVNVEQENGTGAGARSSYLPSRYRAVTRTRPYEFSKAPSGDPCFNNSTFALYTRGHTGNEMAKTYCSNSKDGWRFTRNSLVANAYVKWPVSLSFATYRVNWNGEFQVMVTLGCSSSSGYEIQCEITNSLQEERVDWVSREDLAPNPTQVHEYNVRLREMMKKSAPGR